MGAVKQLAIILDQDQITVRNHVRAVQDTLDCVQVSTMPPVRRARLETELKAMIKSACTMLGNLQKV